MVLKLLITILFFTFSLANSEQDNFYKLKNSKQYEKAYKELIRLQNLKDNSFRPWTYIQLGLLYEYGNGVKKSHKKAYEAYSTAALYNVPYGFSKVGYYFHNGLHVKKNRAEAFKYILKAAFKGDAYGMYLAGLYYKDSFGVVEKNPIAAKKWLQKAAKEKSYAQKLLEKSTFDTNAQIKKRKSYIQTLPKDKKLFGISLGEPLYPELAVEKSPQIETAYTYSWYASSLQKSVLQNYLQRDEKNLLSKLYSKINISTTPLSHSVYEIDGFFDFGSQSSCKRELTNFLQDIQAKSRKRTFLSNFSRAKNIHEYYEYRFLDIGVNTSPTDITSDSIKTAKNLQGTRFIVKCFESGKGLLRAIDFPTFELRVAQSIEKDTFFGYLGKKRVLPSEYMKPLGISLLTPLPTSLHAKYKGKTESISLFGDANTYSITPPKPLKNLSNVTVITSKLTGSVINVKAEGTFKDKEMCQIAMGTTAQNIYKHYSKSKKTLNWYNPKWSNPDNLYVEYYLTPRGLQKQPPSDFKYTVYGIDYTPSIQNVKIYIACEGRRGILQTTSQYGVQMAKKESDLLSTHERD